MFPTVMPRWDAQAVTMLSMLLLPSAPSCCALQSSGLRLGVWASLCKWMACLSWKRLLLKGCALEMCINCLEFLSCLLDCVSCQSCVDHCLQWLCHLLVRKGSPSYAQGRSSLMCVFPMFPALLEDCPSIMEGLMFYIPFLMTKQDCWRRWLSFPLISCSSASGYLSWHAVLRQINGVFCILMQTMAILVVKSCLYFLFFQTLKALFLQIQQIIQPRLEKIYCIICSMVKKCLFLTI